MYTHLVSPANRQQLRHCRGRRVVCMRCINNTCTAHTYCPRSSHHVPASRLTLQINQRGAAHMHVAGWLYARRPVHPFHMLCARTYASCTYASSNEPALRRWIDGSMRRPRKTFDPDDRSIHASDPSRTSGRIGATTYRFSRAACAWSSTWRRFIFGAHVRTCMGGARGILLYAMEYPRFCKQTQIHIPNLYISSMCTFLRCVETKGLKI